MTLPMRHLRSHAHKISFWDHLVKSPILQSWTELKAYASDRPNDVTGGTPKVPHTFDFVFRPFGQIGKIANLTKLHWTLSLRVEATKRRHMWCTKGHTSIRFYFQTVWWNRQFTKLHWTLSLCVGATECWCQSISEGHGHIRFDFHTMLKWQTEYTHTHTHGNTHTHTNK